MGDDGEKKERKLDFFKFRRRASREKTLLDHHFDLKSSKGTETNIYNKEGDEKRQKTYAILQEKRAEFTNSRLRALLMIYSNSGWKLFMLTILFVAYILDSCLYTFCKEEERPFWVIVLNICFNFAFTFDVAILVGLKISKKWRKTLNLMEPDTLRVVVDYTRRLRKIQNHLKLINMDADTTNRIIRYYEDLWYQKSGVFKPKLLLLLPYPLQMEICYDLNAVPLYSSLIFRKLPEAFLRRLSLDMSHQFYLPGDICITNGVLELLSDEDDETPMISFAKGTFLEKTKFINLMVTYPDLVDNIREEIHERINRSRQRKQTQGSQTKLSLNHIKKKTSVFTCINSRFPWILESECYLVKYWDWYMLMLTLYICLVYPYYIGFKRKFSQGILFNLEILTTISLIFNVLMTSGTAVKTKKHYITDFKGILNYRLNTLGFYLDLISMIPFEYIITIHAAVKYHDEIRNHLFYMCKGIKLSRCTVKAATYVECQVLEKTKFINLMVTYPDLVDNIREEIHERINRSRQRKQTQGSQTKLSLNHIKKKTSVFTCINSRFPWILESECYLVKYWDWYMLMLTLYICLVYPYYIGFKRKFSQGILFNLEILTTISLIFNVLMTSGTAVKTKKHYITDFKGILNYRLNTLGFYLDLISMIPFEYIITIHAAVKYHDEIRNHLFYMCKGIKLCLSCFASRCSERSWFSRAMLWDEQINGVRINQKKTKYSIVTSVYFATTVFLSVGYGDYSPGDKYDMAFVAFLSVYGVLFTGYCISEFSAVVTHWSRTKTAFLEIIITIDKFMKENSMHPDIKTRIMAFYELQWQYNSGVEITDENWLEKTIVPSELRKKVLHQARFRALTSIRFFQVKNKAYIHTLTDTARDMILPPGEIVYYGGTVTRELYIIESGYCLVTSNTMREAKQERVIGPGNHLGLLVLLYGVPAVSTVITLTHCKPEELDQIETQAKSQNTEAYLKYYNRLTAKKKVRITNILQEFFNNSFINLTNEYKNMKESYWKSYEQFHILNSIAPYLLMPIAIRPDGIFLKCWALMRVIVAYFTCLLIPIIVSMAPLCGTFNATIVVLEVICYIDMYVMLHVAYYGPKNQLIYHPYLTARNYLKGPFLVDILTCFPWYAASMLIIPKHTESHTAEDHYINPHMFHCAIRMINALQICKLYSIFWAESIKALRRAYFMSVFYFILLTLFFLNLYTSVLITLTCRYVRASDPNDFTHKASQLSLEGPYMKTISAGFGDIIAQDTIHMILSICVNVHGVFFFGYVYARIASLKAMAEQVVTKFQEDVKHLDMFLYSEKVPIALKKTVMEYWKYQWKRTCGWSHQAILGKLHANLNEDAVLYMYENTLREIPLFENVENSFFRAFAKNLREEYFQKGYMVMRSNEVISTMFIIFRGKVVSEQHSTGQHACNIYGYFSNVYFRRRDFLANLLVCYLAFALTLPCHTQMCLFAYLRTPQLIRVTYLSCLTPVQCISANWMTKPELNLQATYSEGNYFKLYIAALWYMINLITITGTGDVSSQNSFEVVETIIVIIVIKFCTEMSAMISAHSSSRITYDYGINELRDGLHDMDLSDHQMNKMWDYVRQLWNRQQGRQMPQLIHKLPFRLRCEVMEALYGSHIRDSVIFNKTDDDFRRMLSMWMKHCVFFSGNYIVQCGDSDQCIYFIHRGQGLFVGVSHHFSFRARTVVDIVYLKLDCWKYLLDYYPKSAKIVQRKVENVYLAI
ncbi:putative tetrameric potassium-selective cyclic nucleotide gated channel [Operophtera brumata]|uniref:Putative tetrameric potassium-selective cyclic nucleotide gated channel n=1 Tax=Operophtera brumata TaxID=104452 RepID=A0A0L7LQS3_OPEBR|nr:putative tetrameric potassium-selective cyclic nucleotide gated channel [Operophtera brumata]